MTTPTAPIDIPTVGSSFWDEIGEAAQERIYNADWVITEVNDLISTTLGEMAESVDATYANNTDEEGGSDVSD